MNCIKFVKELENAAIKQRFANLNKRLSSYYSACIVNFDPKAKGNDPVQCETFFFPDKDTVNEFLYCHSLRKKLNGENLDCNDLKRLKNG